MPKNNSRSEGNILVVLLILVALLFVVGALYLLVSGQLQDGFDIFDSDSNNSSSLDKNDGSFPLHPDARRAIDSEGTWEIGQMQPTVVGFQSDNGADYMIVTDGESEFKVFLSGTAGNETTKGVYLATTEGSSLITLREIQNMFDEGDQIGVYYLRNILNKV